MCGNRNYMRTLYTFPFNFAGNSKLLCKNYFLRKLETVSSFSIFWREKKKSFVKLWDNFKKSNLCVIGVPKE